MSSFLKSFRFKAGKDESSSSGINPPQTQVADSQSQIHFLQLSTTGVAVDEHGNYFTTYNVEATFNGQHLLLPRRYQQFVDLNNAILSLPQTQRPKTKEMPHLTGKKYLSMNQEVIEKRLRKLNIYLKEVSALVSSFPRIGDALQVFFQLQDAGSAEPPHQGPEDDSSGDEDNNMRQPNTRQISSVAPHPALVADSVTASEAISSTSSSSSSKPQHPLDTHSQKTAVTNVSSSLSSISNHPPPSSSSSSALSSSPQGTLKQPQPLSSSSMNDVKCMACGRSKEGQQRQSSSPSDAFCSPQCERFYNALLSNNMTLKSGQIIHSGAAASLPQPPKQSIQFMGSDVESAESDSHSRRKESEPASSSGGKDEAAIDEKESLQGKFGNSPISGGEENSNGSSNNEGGRISSTRFRLAVKEQRTISDMLLGPLRKMGTSSGNSQSAKASSATQLPSPSYESSIGIFQAPSSVSLEVSGGASSNEASTTHFDVVVRTGLLWKQGANYRNWKVRRIVVKDRTLFYYRTSISQLLGKMLLMKVPSPAELVAVADSVAHTAAGGNPAQAEVDPAYKNLVSFVFSAAEFPNALFSGLTANGFFFAKLCVLRGLEPKVVPPMQSYLGLPVDPVFEMPDESLRALPRELSSGGLITDEGVLPFLACIVTPDRELLIGCESAEEFSSWISSLRSMVRNEQMRLLALLKALRPSPSTLVSQNTEISQSSTESRTDATTTLSESSPSTMSTTSSTAAASAALVAAASNTPSSITPPRSPITSMPSPRPTILSRMPSGPLLPTTPEVAAGNLNSVGLSLDVSSSRMSIMSHRSPSATALVKPSSEVTSAPTPPPIPPATTATTTTTTLPTVTAVVSVSVVDQRIISATDNTWEISEDEITITDMIGKGSFGEVYKGRVWGSDVAVKLLNTAAAGEEALESLGAEVAILAQLRHPNVVLYLGASTALPNVFVVTEWCERGSLSEMLYDRSLPMSAAMRISLALQTAQGMCYLHTPRRGIIHRDLKSHNLLVTRDFTVKVADFGLTIKSSSAAVEVSTSKEDEDAGGKSSSSSSSDGPHAAANTGIKSGAFYGVQGTPQFMAPEVLEGQRYNGSVDVYSFGIVLCELVGRILPYSDVYRRFDFVDAVLEEGAMPTIPRWCGPLPSYIDPESSSLEPGISTAAAETSKSDSSGAVDFSGVTLTFSEAPTALTREGLPWRWLNDEEFAPLPVTAHTASSTAPPIVSRHRANSDQNSTGSGATKRSAPAPSAANKSSKTSPSASSNLIGGVDSWRVERGECSGALKLLIESCLARDADARPSFEELADVLRALLHHKPRDLFMQLEVPRLREALCYGDSLDAAVAANEIVHFASYALFAAAPHIPTNLAGFNDLLAERMAVTANAADAVANDASKGQSLSSSSMNSKGEGGEGGRTALITRFPAGSVSFMPILPFAPPPSGTVSQMYAVPYVDLPTVLESAPQLLCGLSCRLRSSDFAIRQQLGIPLFCNDLSLAIRLSAIATEKLEQLPGLVLVRENDTEGNSTSQILSVFVDGYVAPPSTISSGVSISSAAISTPSGGEKVATSSHRMPPTAPAAAPTSRAAAASKAALAKNEEEQRKKKQAEAASIAQLVHALGVLLQVMDAGLASGWGDGDRRTNNLSSSSSATSLREPSLPLLHNLALPPAGSSDSILLSQASRIIYCLSTVICASRLAPWESSFICRPTGGSGSAGLDLLSHVRTKTVSNFPMMPDLGADTISTAAVLLRDLWARFPLLRSSIAHVVSVSALAMAASIGIVTVMVQRPVETKASSGGNSAAPEWIFVTVPEEIIQARFLGVVLERLNRSITQKSQPGFVDSNYLQHPLVAAVETRLKASVMRRPDGVIVGSFEVEGYDQFLE